jgi:hypothetical protein
LWEVVISEVRAFIVRHRVSIQDIALVLGVMLLAGFIAFEFSFVDNLSADKRVEFEELIALAGILIVAVSLFGWRRMVEQEREIARRIAAERRAHDLAHR